ncbi:division/cell wall cluster transcriptional repressor MraZ [Halothermothrix orenii]|uniref:Transcriptional regulator MraZ n=1 Tax=Halothermothrix orenii (strain H 168 / OCM 544 / DSM 9562) TaxID=373903 RepID=MRAZ_HALOH|nr:division/cell wall cluster transcriptional repressor MraZ [Halothermothrix orenii]B8CWI7.1 RecName: Full=Transcriptional regulator MraZ [Halothermothrix orenii H 168]ACL69656.1 MraZ protein [Halothermothrix orenii H 168]
MFMGEYKHNMDSKGRIIIPAKFRSELGDKFVATRGLDHCLFVYPMHEWSKLEKKLTSLPITSKNARTFVRFFFSGATECEFDKQGRISIPSNLREYAELQKEVVIIGLANRIELWSSKRWGGYLDSAEESYEEIAAAMEDLGI